jgi:hypothetical protein
MKNVSTISLGCAIIAERDGTVILKAGYGWANRAEQIAFTTYAIAQCLSNSVVFASLVS